MYVRGHQPLFVGYIYTLIPLEKSLLKCQKMYNPQDTDISGALNVASYIFYKQIKVSLLNQILEVFEIHETHKSAIELIKS